MANQQTSNKKSSNPLGNLGLIVMGILALVALFYAAKLAFNLIYLIAPVLLIATLFIDHKVFINYGKWIISLFKTNPLYGIGAGAITFFAYPVVSIALFLKALLNKKLKEVKGQFEKKKEGDYVEYEELPAEPVAKQKPQKKEELIELPPIKEKIKQTKTSKNEYEDLFGE